MTVMLFQDVGERTLHHIFSKAGYPIALFPRFQKCPRPTSNFSLHQNTMVFRRLTFLTIIASSTVTSSHASCDIMASSNRIRFNDSTYYISNGFYSFKTSADGCAAVYSAGTGFEAYIPGIESELEFLRLQYIFASKRRKGVLIAFSAKYAMQQTCMSD